jgi:hypothetical protein
LRPRPDESCDCSGICDTTSLFGFEAMAKPDRLRILLSMRNFWYVRIFESVVRRLAERGHQIHLLIGHDPDPTGQWTASADALVAASPNITMAFAHRSIDDRWLDLRMMLRLGADYARFVQPQYEAAPILRERARDRVPELMRNAADYAGPARYAVRSLLRASLRAAERALPPAPELETAVREYRPDVTLVTPLIDLGSYQHDVVRVSRACGIPTGVCVGSWDHLSSKALIRDQPDAVFVWNWTQKREAVTMHGVAPERVTVTGAQCFDHWFDRQPTLARDAFAQKVGLDASRPFVLYVCSALFEGSPNEAQFVLTWLSALRTCGDERLRNAGVLIRPHPKRSFEWDDVDLSSYPNVALWPRRGTAPSDAPSKADYFDSIFHSTAVVGINTSALIEGGIVGRPVHTMLLPEFQTCQEGTLHFHYLLDAGLLRAARTLPEHVSQLAATVGTADPSVNANRAFVEAFVRPNGLHVSATETFVDGVERLAALTPQPLRQPAWAPVARALLSPIATRTSGTFIESIGRQRRYREKAADAAARNAALHEQRAAEKAQRLEDRRLRAEAELRERAGQVERNHAEKLRRRAARQREKEQRLAQRRRDKQRNPLAATLAKYYHRLIDSSSRG